jgi:HPt (histidine-containing phosphotransfer) domain-containing protein
MLSMPVVTPNPGKSNHASSGAAGRDVVFDVDTLLMRCLGDGPLATALVEKFTSRLNATVQGIESSLAAKNWSEAAAKAHSLKGEAGSLAAVVLQAKASLLEEALRKSRFEEATAHFQALKLAAQDCLGARAWVLEQLSQSAPAASEP